MYLAGGEKIQYQKIRHFLYIIYWHIYCWYWSFVSVQILNFIWKFNLYKCEMHLWIKTVFRCQNTQHIISFFFSHCIKTMHGCWCDTNNIWQHINTISGVSWVSNKLLDRLNCSQIGILHPLDCPRQFMHLLWILWSFHGNNAARKEKCTFITCAGSQ